MHHFGLCCAASSTRKWNRAICFWSLYKLEYDAHFVRMTPHAVLRTLAYPTIGGGSASRIRPPLLVWRYRNGVCYTVWVKGNNNKKLLASRKSENKTTGRNILAVNISSITIKAATQKRYLILSQTKESLHHNRGVPIISFVVPADQGLRLLAPEGAKRT